MNSFEDHFILDEHPEDWEQQEFEYNLAEDFYNYGVADTKQRVAEAIATRKRRYTHFKDICTILKSIEQELSIVDDKKKKVE